MLNYAQIQADLATRGYALVPLLSDTQLAEIYQDISHYLAHLPRREGSQIHLSPEELVAPLSRERVKALRSIWPLHHTFGAPVEATAFQLPSVCRLREDPDLYALYRELLGSPDLLVNTDRFCCKLPGSGETEFIHIDGDPHYTRDADPPDYQSMIFATDSWCSTVYWANVEVPM